MATLMVTLEVEVPDTDASYKQMHDFIWFYICQEGRIAPDNPLYDVDYEIKDLQWD